MEAWPGDEVLGQDQIDSDLAVQQQGLLTPDEVDRVGMPLGVPEGGGGSELVIDNQVVKLRHKKTESEPAVIPPLRDSIPSQDVGDPARFRPTSYSTMRNGRRRMEDRHVVLHDLVAHLPPELEHKISQDKHVSFYAVYDGHAGVKAAATAAISLHNKLVESNNFPEKVNAAIQDAINETDQIICNDPSQVKCGTTVALTLIMDSQMHCAWVGDSEVVLGRAGTAIRLVDSHRPDREDENERIKGLGGYVSFWGTWRVNGTMAVSRAIGDKTLKPLLSTDCDMTTVKLQSRDDFFILACDGLWDYLSREDAVQLVYSAISESEFNSENLADLAERLNKSSVSKGSSDNISTIIVFLRPIEDIVKDMENPVVLENRLEGISSTSPLITNPDLIRKSLNPSDFAPAWGNEDSASPTPVSGHQISITPDATPKLENGGEMFSPDPFSSLAQLHPHSSVEQFGQSSFSMEQFGQTTLDDLRPSISPVIPEDSFDQVDSTNSDSPIKVDSGFISPKKDLESDEVSQLMAHAQIQRVDQLLQLYNVDDDSPTPDEEKSLEEILAERRKVEEHIAPAQDDSDDDDGDEDVEAVDLDDATSEESDDFAKVVVRENVPEESGCLVPPSSTLPTSQEPELVTLDVVSPAPHVIPEVNELVMEGSEVEDNKMEVAKQPINNVEQLLSFDTDTKDRNTSINSTVENKNELVNFENTEQLVEVNSAVNNKNDAASSAVDQLITSSSVDQLIQNSSVDQQIPTSQMENLKLETQHVNGDLVDMGPESISFDLADTQQGFMLKTPSADQHSLANFDPEVQEKEKEAEQHNLAASQTPDNKQEPVAAGDAKTGITPSLEGLKLSDSVTSQHEQHGDGMLLKQQLDEKLSQTSEDKTSQEMMSQSGDLLSGTAASDVVNKPGLTKDEDLVDAELSQIAEAAAVSAGQPVVVSAADQPVIGVESAADQPVIGVESVIDQPATVNDLLVKVEETLEADKKSAEDETPGVTTTSTGLCIPALNVIPSTPVRSLSPVPADGENLTNGEKEEEMIIQTEDSIQGESGQAAAILISTENSVTSPDSEPASLASTVSSSQHQPLPVSESPVSAASEDAASKAGDVITDPAKSTAVSKEGKEKTAAAKTSAKSTTAAGSKTAASTAAGSKAAAATAAGSKTAAARKTKPAAKTEVKSKVGQEPGASRKGTEKPGTGARDPASRTIPGAKDTTSRTIPGARSQAGQLSKTGPGKTEPKARTTAATSRVGAASSAARPGAVARTAASRTAASAGTAAVRTKPDDIAVEAAKKPLSSAASRTTSAAARPGAAAARARTRPVAAATDAAAPSSPTKSAAATARGSTKQPAVPRGAARTTKTAPLSLAQGAGSRGVTSPTAGAARSVTSSAASGRSSTTAATAAVRGVTSAPVGGVRGTAVARQTAARAASKAAKDPAATGTGTTTGGGGGSNRPLTSTEARKPSEAASRVAAARAAAAKNSLPRKGKTAAKASGSTPTEEKVSLPSSGADSKAPSASPPPPASPPAVGDSNTGANKVAVNDATAAAAGGENGVQLADVSGDNTSC